MAKLTITDFLARIVKNDSGCHIYSGPIAPNGYGTFGGRKLAHWVSYEHFVAPIPKGKWVLHRCDVRDCVNPAHLFLGNATLNMQDALNKGRCKSAKLTEEQVREIKRDARRAECIAAIYDVSPGSIRKIRNGLTWGHVA